MIIAVLTVLGLCLGSFINALVWRMHTGKSIVKGRSMCPKCKHRLAWHDLIPVLSWLMLRGHCRYCKKPIPAQYPVVELGMMLVFLLSYTFWPANLAGGQWVLFTAWLAASVGLMALLVYDARYMILPNKIIYPTLLLAVLGRVVYITGYEPHKAHALLLWLLAVLIASGVFAVIYMMSAGKWIGYGDVRLGLITGTLLATPGKSFLMIFLASVIGILFVVPALAANKKTLASKLPFGPFLIAATAVIVVFGDRIISWYANVFLTP